MKREEKVLTVKFLTWVIGIDFGTEFCFLPPTSLSAEAHLQWMKFSISLPHSLGILLAYQLVRHFCYFPPKICFLNYICLRAFYKLVCISKNKPTGKPDKMQIVYLCGVIPLIPRGP